MKTVTKQKSSTKIVDCLNKTSKLRWSGRLQRSFTLTLKSSAILKISFYTDYENIFVKNSKKLDSEES